MSFFHFLMAVMSAIWVYWLWGRRKYYKLALTIPGPIGFPLLGAAPYFVRKEEILSEFHKYGKIYDKFTFAWLGTIPVLSVAEPSLAQDILTSPHCVNKSLVYKNAADAFGDNITNSSDPVWSFHRKHMNSAFGPKVLLSFVPIFNEEVNNLMRTLEKWVDTNDAVDLSHTIQKFTWNMSTRTTMGRNPAQDDIASKWNLLESTHCLLSSVTEMIFNPLLAFRVVRKLLRIDKPYEEAKRNIKEFVREVMVEKLDKINNNNTEKQTSKGEQIFIDSAIELMRRGIFTPQEVEDESNIIVIGAFETTGNTILYALILMAMFPEYQQKLYEELETIFPEGGNFDVSYDNTKDLAYMEMFLNESMRVLTPVPMVGRETSDEVKLSNGVVIPAGVQINIFIHGIHRSEAVWGPDAEQFNPDHFLPSNMESKHPYAFIPFTKGLRNCIGRRYGLLTTKITLAKLVRNFKFSTDFQFKDLKLIENVTLNLKEVPLLKMESRKK